MKHLTRQGKHFAQRKVSYRTEERGSDFLRKELAGHLVVLDMLDDLFLTDASVIQLIVVENIFQIVLIYTLVVGGNCDRSCHM